MTTTHFERNVRIAQNSRQPHQIPDCRSKPGRPGTNKIAEHPQAKARPLTRSGSSIHPVKLMRKGLHLMLGARQVLVVHGLATRAPRQNSRSTRMSTFYVHDTCFSSQSEGACHKQNMLSIPDNLKQTVKSAPSHPATLARTS